MDLLAQYSDGSGDVGGGSDGGDDDATTTTMT
jgi:hypothetical protein